MVIFSVFAFIISIVWLYFTVKILIDLLEVIGLIFGFKPTFLGVTFLAWGGSSEDLMINNSLAKKGFAKMALTGCFAGPLFNLLIGLGTILMLQKISGDGPETFEIKDRQALLPLMVIGLLFAQLIMIIIISCISQFKLRKMQGGIQMGYYLLALTIITIAAFTFAS
jgi:sodium/potassium/calcium exchanger 6